MSKRYIYNLNHDKNERDLCILEIKSLFDLELEGKAFISDRKLNPSISPFLKNRLEVIHEAESFSDIAKYLEESPMTLTDYKVEYIESSSSDPYITDKRVLCKDIGLRILGNSLFKSPKITMGITYFEGRCYFGILTFNDKQWQKNKSKPYVFSSSISINIAKALTNIAGNGDFTKKLIDPCCGVGTVLLEGLASGYDIVGWEINSKTAKSARCNLVHFNYLPNVTIGDIADIKESYDASIVDLPYGIFTHTSDDDQLNIIKNAKRISKKVVLVSSVDVTHHIMEANLKVVDYCTVPKSRKGSSMRHIWVCE